MGCGLDLLSGLWFAFVSLCAGYVGFGLIVLLRYYVLFVVVLLCVVW